MVADISISIACLCNNNVFATLPKDKNKLLKLNTYKVESENFFGILSLSNISI